MPSDAMFINQSNEIARFVATEGTLGEMRIGGKVIRWPCAQIGEIAPPAARNQDLFANLLSGFEHQHIGTALARYRRTKQSRRAAAEDDRIILHGPTR